MTKRRIAAAIITALAIFGAAGGTAGTAHVISASGHASPQTYFRG